jgi:hypothetical protein
MSLENFNPYDDLLGLIRSEGKYHNPLTPLVGRITKINDSLTDIEVSAYQMPLYKDDLLIDSWLLDRHTKQFIDHTEGSHIHGGDITGEGLHKHEMKEPLVDKLKVNDLVLLVPYEEKFIIVSKVVSI